MIIIILSTIIEIISIIVIADVLVSYILSPYHPVRVFLDRIVQPMLKPIQKMVPPMQMIDFSPVILIIFLQVVQFVLIQLF